MALTVVSANRIGTGVQVSLLSGNDLYVARGVLVSRTDGQSFGDVAVTAKFSNHQVDIYGDVVSTGNALEVGNGNVTTTTGNRVYISEDSLVRSFSGSAVQVQSAASTLTNDGTLRSKTATVVMGSNAGGAISSFENNGSVIASQTAVIRFSQSTDAFLLVNTGLIKGGTFAYSANQTDAFDTILNSGRMVGDIDLGSGKDLYDGRKGISEGAVFGGSGNDSLLGGASRDEFHGGTGGDRLVGGGGDDFLDGDDDADDIDGGAGNDAVLGGSGNDILRGGSGNDEIFGEFGDDFIDGGSGADLIEGGDGADTIFGGTGADTISGGAGNDIINGDGSGDKLSGGAGDDIIRGGTGDDIINGDGNLDRLFGDSGNDIINGGGSVDTIRGGSGNDTIDGGTSGDKITGDAGADKLTGGTGADHFIYRAISNSTTAAAGRDTILDFTQSQNDRIDLSLIDAKFNTSGNQAFTFIGTRAFSNVEGQLRFTTSSTTTTVSGDIDGDGKADFAIVLTGQITLQSADFIL